MTPTLALQALYLVTPAVLAGIVHAVVIKRNLLSWLARPLDRGKRFRGRPIFGENKTWRGVAVMSLVCMFGVLVQRALYSIAAFRSASAVDYRTASAVAVGAILGLGYSLAELPNSFLKRQLQIRPGHVSRRFAPLQWTIDQADSVAGTTVGLVPLVHPPTVLTLVFAWGLGLHVAFDQLLYVFGVKSRHRPSLHARNVEEGA